MHFNIRQLIAKFGRRMRVERSSPDLNKVHFLHIGKTGGTAVRTAFKDHLTAGKYHLEFHRHGFSLDQIPVGEKVVFVIRDPVSRFISGFYSRQRKGQPRYYSEWNPVEKETFTVFETPNQLATALADSDAPNHACASKAMGRVQHTKHYSKWLISREYFESRKADLFFIGFQESLNQDFEELKQLLGLGGVVSLPRGDRAAHRSPEGLDKSLSDEARKALVEWYREDYELVELCRKIMAEKTPGNA